MPTTKSVTLGGQTFNNMTIEGAASDGTFTFSTAAGTFNILTFKPDANIKITSGVTITTSNLVALGTSGHNILFSSVTATSPATISQASGTVAGNYITMQDITGTGGAAFYLGANSTNNGDNTGWIFATDPPSGQSFTTTGM